LGSTADGRGIIERTLYAVVWTEQGVRTGKDGVLEAEEAEPVDEAEGKPEKPVFVPVGTAAAPAPAVVEGAGNSDAAAALRSGTGATPAVKVRTWPLGMAYSFPLKEVIFPSGETRRVTSRSSGIIWPSRTKKTRLLITVKPSGVRGAGISGPALAGGVAVVSAPKAGLHRSPKARHGVRSEKIFIPLHRTWGTERIGDGP
jgi:hypothetical protein